MKYRGFIFKIRPAEKFDREYFRLKKKILNFHRIKVYFDTCVLGMALDKNIKSEYAKALRRIVESKKDIINPYTSEKTKKEISQHKDQAKQDYLHFIISFFQTIPEENYVNYSGGSIGSLPIGCAPIGGCLKKEDPIYTELKSLFKGGDAEQIFQAIKSDANYFLTIDEKTVLSKRKDFNQFGHKLKLVNPINLENILFAEEDNIN